MRGSEPLRSEIGSADARQSEAPCRSPASHRTTRWLAGVFRSLIVTQVAKSIILEDVTLSLNVELEGTFVGEKAVIGDDCEVLSLRFCFPTGNQQYGSRSVRNATELCSTL